MAGHLFPPRPPLIGDDPLRPRGGADGAEQEGWEVLATALLGPSDDSCEPGGLFSPGGEAGGDWVVAVSPPGEAFPPPLGGAWGGPEAGAPVAGTPMASALRARGRAVDEQPVACFVTVEAGAGAGAHPAPPALAASPALAGRAPGGGSSGASLVGEGQGSDGSGSEAFRAIGGPGGLPAAAVPGPVAVAAAAAAAATPGLDSGASGASADGGGRGTGEVDPSSRPARRRSAAAHKAGEAGERPGSPAGAPGSPTAGRAPRSTRARKTSTWGQKSQLVHPPAAAGGRRAAGGSPAGKGRKGKGAVPRSPSGELSRGTADSELTSAPAAKAQAQPAHQCVRCGTTTTPLWRAGPKGPKTLCNACGVRHMKAMRKKAAGRA